MLDIKPLQVEDYAATSQLWQTSEGVVWREEETLETFARFLDRNPNLSLGAWLQSELIGAVMVGHDARRAYLYHLAVAQKHRRQGIARQLLARVRQNLDTLGIGKQHVSVIADNRVAEQFWQALDWHKRSELVLYSFQAD